MLTKRFAALWVTIFVAVCGSFAFGQETSVTNDQNKAGSAMSQTGTVYLYRIDYDPFIYSFIFSRTLPVRFAPGNTILKEIPKIAGLRKNRYMIMKLAPGPYLFDTRQMGGKLKLNILPGDVRYLRFDQGYNCPGEHDVFDSSCTDRGSAVVEMPLETGLKEIAKMKPIKPGDVQDKVLVTIPK